MYIYASFYSNWTSFICHAIRRVGAVDVVDMVDVADAVGAADTVDLVSTGHMADADTDEAEVVDTDEGEA